MAIDPSQMTGSLTQEQIAQMAGAYENAGALQAQEIANKYKLGTAEIKNNYKMALLQNGISQQTVENTREYQRGLLAQAAAEMQNVGIPTVAINKYVAETNAEIAKGELAVKQGLAQLEQQKFGLSQQQFAEAQQEFVKNFGIEEAGLTGTYNGQQTLAGQNQQFQQGATAAGLTGTYGGQQTLAAQTGLGQLAQGWAQQSGYLPNGQQTLAGRQQGLDEAERQRQYALAVGQFGATLASTPDRYFQARRFAALDAPRLLGQDTSGVAFDGSPTSSVGQMGAYLTGADPSQGYVAPPAFGSYGAPAPGGAPGGASPMSDPNFAAGVMQFIHDNGGTVQDGIAWMSSKPPDDSNRVAAIQSGLANGYGQQQTAMTTQAGMTQPQQQAAWSALTPQQQAQYDPATRAQFGQQVYAGGTQNYSEQGGYATPYGGPSGTAASGRSSDAGSYGGSTSYAEGAGSSTATPDPRIQQVGAIAKASPPSPFDGLNDQDAATLRLMQSIYQRGGQGIAGGELERLKASGNYGFLQSAGNLLGYDPNQLESQYQSYRPAQGSSAMAG